MIILAEEKEKSTGNEENGEGKSGGFDFKIIVAGLVLFLVVMGSTYFILRSLIAPLMPESQKNTASATNVTGSLMSLGEFTTSISDVSGSHFIKVELYAKITDQDKKAMDKVNELMPVIQDKILEILSSKNVADLDVRNRNNLKQELINEINDQLGSNLVLDIYFTSFIMQ